MENQIQVQEKILFLANMVIVKKDEHRQICESVDLINKIRVSEEENQPTLTRLKQALWREEQKAKASLNKAVVEFNNAVSQL